MAVPVASVRRQVGLHQAALISSSGLKTTQYRPPPRQTALRRNNFISPNPLGLPRRPPTPHRIPHRGRHRSSPIMRSIAATARPANAADAGRVAEPGLTGTKRARRLVGA